MDSDEEESPAEELQMSLQSDKIQVEMGQNQEENSEDYSKILSNLTENPLQFRGNRQISNFKRVNASSNSSGQVSQNSSLNKTELMPERLAEGESQAFDYLASVLQVRPKQVVQNMREFSIDISKMIEQTAQQIPASDETPRVESWLGHSLDIENPEIKAMLGEFRFETLNACFKNIGYSLQFTVSCVENSFQIHFVVSGDKQFKLIVRVECAHWLNALKFGELKLASLVCSSRFGEFVSKLPVRDEKDFSRFIKDLATEHRVELVSQEEINSGKLVEDVAEVEVGKSLRRLFEQRKFSSLLRKMWKKKFTVKLTILKISESEDSEDSVDSDESYNSDTQMEPRSSNLTTFSFLSNDLKIFETKCTQESSAFAKDLSALVLLSLKFPVESLKLLESP